MASAGSVTSTENFREIRRLYQLEYGERAEVGLRFAGVAIGGLILCLAADWHIVWIWLGVYVVSHLLYHRFLVTRPANATMRDCHIAGALLLVVIAAFVWLPTLLVMQMDQPVMVFCGATLIGALLVYLVRRSDAPLFLVQGQIALVSMTLLLAMSAYLQRIDSPFEAVAVLMCGAALIGYFAQALWTGRSQRIFAQTAASRSSQAEKMAGLGTLAGGVAHDFNNALTAIMGNLDLYAEFTDQAERDAAIGNARAACINAEAVIRKLLVYTRQTSATLHVVDANAVLEDLIALTRPLVRANVTLTVVPAPRPLMVRIDRPQVESALINLLVNAIDALQEGGSVELVAEAIDAAGQITCADGETLPAGPYVALSVQDDGPGIPVELRDKVMEPFFTTKPTGKGTGLGLPMVLGVAHQQGGSLLIESGPRGTRATILLPRPSQG